MGYLNNTTVTIDAILTKKGRELLAKGRSQFNITQFALADDEVDYDLWNPSHPLGIDYFGTVIENMPVTEAVSDETQSLKYKLITMDRGSISIPYLKIQENITEVSFAIQSGQSSGTSISQAISPQTWQVGPNGPQVQASLNSAYTFTLLDNTYVDFVGSGISGVGRSVTLSTTNVTLIPRTPVIITASKSTKLIITGNDTGARLVIPITVSPAT
jgi:hypothetical protein